jgi:hypothetical protein
MFKKQFLLTSKDIAAFNDFIKIKIGSYFLYYHKDLPFSSSKHNHKEAYLLGSLYSWETPTLLDAEILDSIIPSNSIEEFLNGTSNFYGEFVILYKNKGNLILFNDACAQREIYYDTSFEAFGTQPKIIAKVKPIQPNTDKEAIKYYESEYFKKNCVFVGDSTHLINVKHLLANHYINLTTKEVKRFFPILKKQELPLDDVAKKAALILKGYVKAISLRHNIIMPVTGGYDSRLLFLASLELTRPCHYFVSKHSHMTNDHNDITIPKKLTALFNKKFQVVEEIDTPKQDFKKEYIDSIDFPRYVTISNIAKPTNVLLNANISEVSSCLLGFHTNVNAVNLAALTSQAPYKFRIEQYDTWLQKTNEDTKGLDYHILDLFYWEEFESNWVAKLKTEANAININVMSPFNSRYLLTLLLSVKRSKRGVFGNKLYDRIIYYLSENNKNVINLPINPDLPTKTYRFMSKIGVLEIYQAYKLKKKSKKMIKNLK